MLCVGMQWVTLRVTILQPGAVSSAKDSGFGANCMTIVPTLRVGMQFETLCVIERFCDGS
ncbi:hypothetical protein AO070_05430 [Pseudomonas syringae pv. syringae PD2766]|nr:hypothetical protein AO070_05430 [Pseudomonas syringae pv. syringae PD2766]